MEKAIKTVRRFNQQYRTLSFSELMKKADEEYLEIVVQMDKDGRPVEESKFDSQGELEERNQYSYSAGGKLTEHILLYALDDVTERRVLTRGSKDLLLEEVKHYGDDTGERIEYMYDEKDRIKTVIRHDEEGDFDFKEEFNYDEKTGLESRTRLDKAGKVQGSVSYKHDSDRLMEEKEYDAAGALLSVSAFRYDDKGNEVFAEQRKSDGGLISAVYSTYDDSGRLLERKHKDFHSKIVRYTYDDQGRLATQELFDGSGLLLRKNFYEYDPEGRILNEQVFEIDTSRGGRDKHYGTRYEYDFFD